MLRLLNRLLSRPRADGAVPPRLGPELETMEPRLLYSADLMPTGLDATAPSAEIRLLDSTPIIDAATEAAQTHRQEIVFIDAGIDNAEQLLDALDRDRSALQVIWLDPNANGIDQISAALAGRSDIGAIHILSHGANGQVMLGNSTVDSATLTQRADTITGWRSALTDDADILLYGCDVAGDAAGLTFIESLARLTGADVAASEDLTGTGGDWVLERQIGAIDSIALSSMRWQGALGVTASSSGDINVNTVTFGTQKDVAVAMLNDGRWVATWTNETLKKVYGQIFNADGSKQDSFFQLSATFSGSQSQAAVATDGNDRIVFVFSSSKDGNEDIYARIFNSAGVSQTGDIKINEGSTAGDQSNASVAMNSSGDFVVSWDGQGSGDNEGIFMRRFDAAGAPSTGITVVNTTTSGRQEESDVALTNDGRVVVTWFDDSNGKRIVARQFDALNNGGTQILMPGGHPNDPVAPAVATDGAGNFVVVWNEGGLGGPKEDIYMQSFTASGSPIGTVVQVNTTTSEQQEFADVAINAAGYTVVTWQSMNQDGSAEGIFARSYEPGASNPSAEIPVNLYTADNQSQPAVAINSRGQIVIAWEGERAGDSSALSARTFDWPEASTANTAPVLTPVAPSLVAINEDAGPPSGATGTLISTLLSLAGSGSGPQNVTDPDLTGTTGLALLSADNSNGNWYFSIDGGNNWTLINSATLSNSNALLLAADSQTRIAFAPNANFNTATGSRPSLDFRAWDRSSGNIGDFADTGINGGNSAFSTATDTARITVNAINDPPVITTNLLAISEGQTVELTPAMLAGSDVEDPPGGLLFSVTSLTGGFFSRVLNPTVATTSFTQQEVIDGQIQFVHDGAEAAPTYTLTLGDTEGLSSAASPAVITFTNMNDAPELSGPALAMSVVQGNGSPVGKGAVGTAVGALISAGTNFTDPDAGALRGIAVTGVNVTTGTWWYTTNNGTTWQTIGAVSDTNALLLHANSTTRLYFQGITPGPDATALSLRAWDRTDGSANGQTGVDITPGGGQSAFGTITLNIGVTVQSGNSAPLLGAGPAAISINEDPDAPVPGTTGISIGTLFGAVPVSDADGNPLGIALSGMTQTNGSWWFSTDSGGNWDRIDTVSFDSDNPLLLANDGLTQIIYAPNTADDFGADKDKLAFRAWDATIGVNGQTTAKATLEANNAVSGNTIDMSIDILPVNDAPSVSAIDLGSINEDQPRVITLAELIAGATDIEGDTLSVSNLVVQLGSGTVSGSGPWTFTPTLDWSGAVTIRFDVSDGTDTVSNTATLTVNAVNDPPVLTPSGDATLSLDEDSGLPVGAVGIPIESMVGPATAGTGPRNVTDPDASGTLGIAIIGADTTNGNWYVTTDGGAVWTPLGGVTATSGLLLLDDGNTRLAFEPNANYAGTTPSGLRFVAWDTSSGTAGALADTTSGTAFSAASDTLTLIVRPVNDAPAVIAIDLGNIAEDNGRLITQADLLAGATDLDGDTLSAVTLAITTGSGVLIDNANGTWTFTPTADWNGAVSFSFNVDDGTTTTANTAALVVDATNDAPAVIAVDLGNIAEDNSRLITQADLLAGATDLDGDTLSAVTLAITSGSGVLIDNANGTWTFTPTADWNGAVSFSFNVDDGTTITTANTAALVVDAVNDMPDIGLNQLTLNEGDTITLGSGQLDGSDVDHADSAIVYTVSGLSNGYFALTSAPTTPVTQFTQADVAGGQVRFVHNGSEAAPTYTLTLSDGTLSSPASVANITFTNLDDAPSISGIADQVIITGSGFGPVSFTIADAETSAAALTVTARSSNPSVLPDSAIVLTGSGASRSLSVVGGYSGVSGAATIIIDVSDGSTVSSLPVAITALAPAASPTIPSAELVELAAAEKSPLATAPKAEAEADVAADVAPAEVPALADVPAPTPAAPLLSEQPTETTTPQPNIASQDESNVSITVSNIKSLHISLSTTEVLALLYTPTDVVSPLSIEGQVNTALREARLEQAFDQLRENADSAAQGEQQGIGATMVTGAGLTIGYVAWLIRGGVLLTSLLSTMPAWRLLDPLPILNSAAGKRRSEDDDSLESMVDQADDEQDQDEPSIKASVPGVQP